MKKLLSLFLAVAMLLSLTACQAAEPECNHEYEIVKEVESTCEKAGYIKYECTECGHTYKLNDSKLEHTYVYGVCTQCGNRLNAAEREDCTIAVIAKGETHAFWQAVKAGAEAAAREHGYAVTFRGPVSESESEVTSQLNMVQMALADPNVKAIALATIGIGFSNELIEAYEKGIPVVEFDSGLYANGADITPGKDPTIGSVATDNRKAGALVAEKFYTYLKSQNVLTNGYKIGVIQHSSTPAGIDRAEGFVKKINELAKADSITLQINCQEKQNNAGEYKAALTTLKEWGAQSIFMTNEGVVNEVYPEVKDNADTYKDILFCGFDCGTNQYNWIKDGGETCALLVGSVAQDSYCIGYEAVKLAIAKLEGKEVKDVGIAGVWYTTENIDDLKDKNVFYMG